MTFFWAFLSGFAMICAGAYAWWQLVEHRLTVIESGKLYTSGAMPPQRLQKVVRRLGIRTVVDLRTPGEGEEKIAAEKAALDACGVHHLNLQSPQVPPDDIRDRYLRWLEDPEHLPALVHCNHGEGRAVLFGALWRIEFMGLDPEKARKKCRLLTTRGSSFDLRKVKGAYLHTYQPQRKR
ncbi:MAG: fused DSP-PTPase phosphatase/NAD kinase-like protein [Kiritimatiellia bacterium]